MSEERCSEHVYVLYAEGGMDVHEEVRRTCVCMYQHTLYMIAGDVCMSVSVLACACIHR